MVVESQIMKANAGQNVKWKNGSQIPRLANGWLIAREKH